MSDTAPFTLNLQNTQTRPRKQRNDSQRVKLSADISITPKQHEDLLQYCRARLAFADDFRDRYVDLFREIDKEVAGWRRLDKDDLKRQRDNRAGKGPTPIKVNLQLTATQLDEAVTFLMSVMSPDDAMYTAIANKDQQAVATAFSQLMNRHAKTFKHYRNLVKFFYQGLKYNLSAMLVEWLIVRGNTIADEGGSPKINENVVVDMGNKIEALDMYNLLFDPSVDPIELAEKGEFFATVKLETPFRIKKMEADGEIFGSDRFVDKNEHGEYEYYEEPEELREEIPGSNSSVNWHELLSAGQTKEVGVGHERIDLYIWLNPSQFGLEPNRRDEPANKLSIWRLTIFQGKYIVSAEKLTNAHGMLPVCVCMPVDDGTGMQAPSFAEILIPMQRFASHLINIYQDACRKKLFGLTIYDKNIISLDDAADVVNGLIGAKRTGQNTRMSDAVHHINDAPETRWTLDDVDKINGVMQKILPTEQQNQVASLERATQYQAAAVVQGSNRRNLKIAKLINDQALNGCRKMQLMNIYQFQDSTEILSDETGETLEIKPAEFRQAKLEFKISEGLLGIDRLLITETYKELINMIIQNQVALERVDMISLLDYFTNILGDKTDFKQFEIKTPFDNLTPEEKQAAFQLLQQQAQQQQGGGGQVAQLAPPAA